MKPTPTPTFFTSAAELEGWFEANHDRVPELWIGLVKKGSGLVGVTYPEALDLALGFGWIDGVRKSLDEGRWTIRFTPRTPHSVWSQVNLKRVAELEKLGLMYPPGQKAFAERDPRSSQRYSYENRPRELDPEYEATFRESPGAWDFFCSQASSYRRAVIFWVMGAKQEETRQKRLRSLIGDSARGERLKQFVSLKKPAAGTSS
jgi:uncharacterized protein YdeI (YjbR/CyaY-like superfamily)